MANAEVEAEVGTQESGVRGWKAKAGSRDVKSRGLFQNLERVREHARALLTLLPGILEPPLSQSSPPFLGDRRVVPRAGQETVGSAPDAGVARRVGSACCGLLRPSFLLAFDLPLVLSGT